MKNIEEMENQLYSDTTGAIDKEKVGDMIAAYVDFAGTYPKDEKAPIYLFRAAEVCMGLNRSEEALQHLEKICNDYPGHDKAITGLFLKGFIYETQLKNIGLAKKFYSDFVKKYPDHTLADDAKFSLDNLGKSDEDIIREFEEKRDKENLENQNPADTAI